MKTCMPSSVGRSVCRSLAFALVASVVLVSGSQSFAGIVYEGSDYVIDSGSIPLGDKIPLLLIHGWDEKIPSQIDSAAWQDFINYFLATPELNSRYKLYEYDYLSNVISVDQLGEKLGRILDRIDASRPEFASRKFVILARSMGGLVARSFMEERQQGGTGTKWQDRIIHLTVQRKVTLQTRAGSFEVDAAS
jgi:pimeloyl-ACP methyl ester carboxylesterase